MFRVSNIGGVSSSTNSSQNRGRCNFSNSTNFLVHLAKQMYSTQRGSGVRFRSKIGTHASCPRAKRVVINPDYRRFWSIDLRSGEITMIRNGGASKKENYSRENCENITNSGLYFDSDTFQTSFVIITNLLLFIINIYLINSHSLLKIRINSLI